MKHQKIILFTTAICFIFFAIVFITPRAIQSQGLDTEEVIVEDEYVMEDVAALFYYGNGDTRIHTWVSEGESFKYSGSNGWFSTKKGGYEGNKLLHCVSGDWNADGFTDMAGFYDYGQGVTRIHVWLNTGGNRFDYQHSAGWWESGRGYDAKNIVGATAGDFNGDGYDDIAGFYDYGNNETRIHVWLSNGSDKFKYEGSRGWWAAKGYPAAGVQHIVGGEFGD